MSHSQSPSENAQDYQSFFNSIRDRIENVNIHTFSGMDEPLFLIADNYPGVWLEHVYDSILYARMFPERTSLAAATLRAFIRYQRADGQLPCYIWDVARYADGPRHNFPFLTRLGYRYATRVARRLAPRYPHNEDTPILQPYYAPIGYGQIQEVVSFARLSLLFYEQSRDRELLRQCYDAAVRWEQWLDRYRVSPSVGLVMQYVGYDTGHDNSARCSGFAHPADHRCGRFVFNAACPPAEDGVTPLFAVDMNCNYYATLIALSEMASLFGDSERSEGYVQKAAAVKAKLLEVCYDPEDGFFYDADRYLHRRRIRSSAALHLLVERILDPDDDRKLIDPLYNGHIRNPREFWTAYPFPSVAVNDPSVSSHKMPNSWGYYSQANIALRTTLWMDYYGWKDDCDRLCRIWLDTWLRYFGQRNCAQELDPIDGRPTDCSDWYSSCMVFCLYAAKRLGYV